MIQAIVTDIEGTTSSLSFVKDILFPYSRARIGDFVRERQSDSVIAALLDEARELVGQPLSLDALIAQLIEWIDQDQKVKPLKALQGHIWQHGYANGDFRGHVYADAVEVLRRWHDQRLALYVYSSGSVQAQKLLFAHTDYGDLTPLFTDYFDTAVGGKKEPASYRRIAATIKLAPAQIIFLSDIVEELDAARDAGLQTYWLIRSGPTPIAPSHPVARDFHQIRLPS